MQRKDKYVTILISFIAGMAVGFAAAVFAVNKSKQHMKNLYK